MNKLYEKVHPTVLFFCSIACLPAVFFQDNILFVWILASMFIVLRKLRGDKVRLMPSFFICISIVFFAMLTPSGKIFAAVGGFRITEGALLLGLKKSAVLLSMVFISQYAITKSIQIRGKFGFFINNMFMYFDIFTELKTKFSIKNPVASIDSILLEVYSNDKIVAKLQKNTAPKQNASSWLLCLFPFFVSYTLLFMQYAM